MFTNPVATGTVAFLVVFVGMIALGYLLTHGDGKAAPPSPATGRDAHSAHPTHGVHRGGPRSGAGPSATFGAARQSGNGAEGRTPRPNVCAPASFTPAPPQCSSGPRFS